VAVDRLRQLAAHAFRLHEAGILGAVVECGTWRGGALALVDWAFRLADDPRPIWGVDSFAGMTPPCERDSEFAHRGFYPGWCSASQDDARRAFGTTGGDPGRARLVSGWLDDTLPGAQTGPIALLHIDVDWYESVSSVLTNLFDRMA